jgi:hypothetical protein
MIVDPTRADHGHGGGEMVESGSEDPTPIRVTRTGRRVWLALVVGTWTSAALPAVAHAYCRTTTCDFPETENEPRCKRDTSGCSISGMPLRWQQRCVSFSVEAEGSPLRGISYDEAAERIGSSMSKWAEADCAPGRPSIEVLAYAPYECASTGYSETGPNSNAWVFRDDDWPVDESHTPWTLALTSVTADLKTGEIYDVDVEINSQIFSLTNKDASLLSAVALHEAGHFFGLADLYSRADGSATMYGYYQASLQFAQTPSRDDVAGLCAIYPPSQPETRACDATPARGFSAACPAERESAGGCQCRMPPVSGSRWAGPPALLLFLFSLGLRGARRKRPVVLLGREASDRMGTLT